MQMLGYLRNTCSRGVVGGTICLFWKPVFLKITARRTEIKQSGNSLSTALD